MPDHPEILLRQRDWLCALAQQLVDSTQFADELAHDALADAVVQPLPQRAGPRSWLASILRRQLAGRQRAEFRRRAREVSAARPEAQPSAGDTVARFEVHRNVADAVLALAEPYRTAVLLRFWEELSPAVIARRLDVPVETVRTRLKRGLQHLRERLDREHGGDRSAWALPLLATTRPLTVTSSLLTGVLLMHAQKLIAVCVVAAAALLLVVASPWSSRGGPQASPGAVVPAVASAVGSAATPPPGDQAGARAERVALPTSDTWLEVTGTVIDDESGAPVADGRVQLIGWTSQEQGDIAATTSADGAFTVRDERALGHNGRRLVVRAPGHATILVPVSFDAETRTPQRVDLGSIHLACGTLFSGRVIAVDGTPVAGATLWLPQLSMDYSGHGPQNMLERVARVGTTDALGTFSLDERVAPDVNHQNLLFANAPQGLGWCTFEASKQRRDVGDLVIRLRPTGAIRVRVATAVDQPVAGAYVFALPRFRPIGITQPGIFSVVSGEESVRARFIQPTDDRGEVLLTHLPIGEPGDLPLGKVDEHAYEVLVRAAGYGDQRMVACALQAGAEQRIVVRLAATREVAVDVDVRDDLGAPIPGAAIQAFGEAPAEALTDADGHAHLVFAAAVKLLVRARCASHRSDSRGLELDPGASTARVALTLVRTLPLDGRVVDQFGAAVEHMSVYVDNRRLAETDANGAFHVDDVPCGMQRVVIACGVGIDTIQWIGQQTPESVDAAAGPVTFVLQRRVGSVDVRAAVVDASTGEPLELADVGLWLFEPSIQRFGLGARTENNHGVVTCKHTPAGRWRLDVRTVSGQRGSREFTLTEGQSPLDLRVELPTPGAVAGQLRFVGVVAPSTVTIDVLFARQDPLSFRQYRYPGTWRAAASQAVSDQLGGTGRLRMQPALEATFHLDAADPTEDLVFTVRGEGVSGEATVRVASGETKAITIEVRAAK